MASKTNNAYWAKRQKKLTAQLEKDEARLDKKLAKAYDTQQAKLEQQISAFYNNYGRDDIIEYRNLMERMSDADKTLLMERMDDFTMKYPEYQHLMPVRENIYKLNRLEGLKQSIYVQQMELGALEQKEIEAHLKRVAERGIDLSAERMGFGKNFHAFNSETVARTINAKWVNDKNFSDRIWDNRKKLSDYLNTDFAQAVARGDSYEKIRRDMATKFHDVSRRRMKDLIYTEGSFVMNESSIAGFEDAYEEYKYDALGDARTCERCSGLDGQTFKIKDRKPGINFPPMHTKCRCTFLIVIESNKNQQTSKPKTIDALRDNQLGKRVRFKTGGMDSREYAWSKSQNIKNYKTVQLDKVEYATVMSALNTDLTAEQREQRIISKAIGNYMYKVENKGYNNYRVIERKEIPDSVTDLFGREV